MTSPSSTTSGAASAAPLTTVTRDGATPALADQWEAEARDAIENVTDPDEAERLLGQVTLAAEAMRIGKLGKDRERRWHGIRVKAEARYGELLGPATDKGGGRRTVTDSDSGAREAKRKARKVAEAAATLGPEAFVDYVDTDPNPSRDGLLRKANGTPPKQAPRQRNDDGQNMWEDDAVLAWVARRLKAGRSTYQLQAESKAGTHGWPASPNYFGQNAAEKAVAIIRDRERRGDTTRRRGPSESGKRLRELHAEKRAGRGVGDLWHLQIAIAQAVGLLERFDLPELDWSEDAESFTLEIYSDLERHARWNDAALDACAARMDSNARQRKLKLLRDRADDPSSTLPERQTAARLADKLASSSGAKRLTAR
jgi:hypothetical protein